RRADRGGAVLGDLVRREHDRPGAVLVGDTLLLVGLVRAAPDDGDGAAGFGRAGYGDSGAGFVGVDAIAAGNGIDGRYPGRVLVITAATSTATTITTTATATATATATTAATARGGGEAERADAGEDRAGAGACGSACAGRAAL